MIADNPVFQNKHFLLTRSVKDNAIFANKLKQLGAMVTEFPCITIAANQLDETMRTNLKRIEQYDWIILTSANGVTHFLQHLADQGIDTGILKSKNIVAIGPETAAVLQSHNLPVHSVPIEFLTDKIPEVLGSIANANILLPRSSLANKALSTELTKRGAHVVDIPIYETAFLPEDNEMFQNMTAQANIDYILFTSSSTVTGFLKRVTDRVLRQKAFATMILAIGPVTAQTAKEVGFSYITIADTHTTDGMIKKLKGLHHDRQAIPHLRLF